MAGQKGCRHGRRRLSPVSPRQDQVQGPDYRKGCNPLIPALARSGRYPCLFASCLCLQVVFPYLAPFRTPESAFIRALCCYTT